MEIWQIENVSSTALATILKIGNNMFTHARVRPCGGMKNELQSVEKWYSLYHSCLRVVFPSIPNGYVVEQAPRY